MLATALSPGIGYERASAIARKAYHEGSTLREAALSMGVSGAELDRIFDPKTMVRPPAARPRAREVSGQGGVMATAKPQVGAPFRRAAASQSRRPQRRAGDLVPCGCGVYVEIAPEGRRTSKSTSTSSATLSIPIRAEYGLMP